MNDAYTKALKKIMMGEAPAPSATRPREDIEFDIAKISEHLKSPMPNVLRLDLVEARRSLRKQLENLI